MANREDDGFGFDTTTPMTDGTVIEFMFNFRYRALARGGAYEFKNFRVHVKVCGFEVIELSDDDEQLYELWLDLPRNEYLEVDPRDYFVTNDSYCPTINYEIIMDSEDFDSTPTARDLNNFVLLNPDNRPDTWTHLVSANNPGTYHYHIYAESVSRMNALKSFEQINYPCRPSIARIIAPSR